MDRGAVWRCLGTCLGALAVLAAVVGPARASDGDGRGGYFAQTQADKTPGRHDTNIDTRRIKPRQLPATDSPLSLLWLPLATSFALALIALGTMAIVRVRNAEDEAWLRHVSESRQRRRQRLLPPPPPPSHDPIPSPGGSRIARAWRVLLSSNPDDNERPLD
jgi:hypothetical protein